MNTRILLADDHTIVLDGLREMLARQPDFEVVGTVKDGREAVQRAAKLSPHLVIMDTSMPGLNGIEATRQIRAKRPETKVLCLSMHAEKPLVVAALDAGASGYLLKGSSVTDLIEAIHSVIEGHTYMSPAVADIVVEDYKSLRSGTISSTFSVLTDREREVLQLLAEGHPTKDIAERLGLSVKTVGTHRQHMMEKLNIHSVAGLTKYAIREGLTSAERDLS